MKIEKRYSIRELQQILEEYAKTLDTACHAEFICEVDFVQSAANQFLEWVDKNPNAKDDT